MSSSADFITIPFSHYCEKARWALDHHGIDYEERQYLPMLHLTATLPAARQRTVPILRTGEQSITDSTEILHFADLHGSGDPLFGDDDEDVAAEIQEWEEFFDKSLGPAARRYTYYHLMETPGFCRSYLVESGRGWQRKAMQLGSGLVLRAIKGGYRIDDEGARRSRQRIDEVFTRVEETLTDGRTYLTGDRFTAADLTFASLGGVLVFPDEYGFPFPDITDGPRSVQNMVSEFRTTLAGQFILRLYAENRAYAHEG